MPLSTTASLARQTRPLRTRLLGDEPLTKAQRWAIEDFILQMACAGDAALIEVPGYAPQGREATILRTMLGERVAELLRDAEAGS